MTTIRAFSAFDLLSFNNVNLDYFTETYSLAYYMHYLARWPHYCYVALSSDDKIKGYSKSDLFLVFGKSEGRGKEWHGHVTALTVAPEYRRQGVGRLLMERLEEASKEDDCYFVDLFVRSSNSAAIEMYKRLGYVCYRRVLNYYSEPEEDGWDMRKSLPRDVNKETMIPMNRPVEPEETIFPPGIEEDEK